MSSFVLLIGRLGFLAVLGSVSPVLAQPPGFGETGESQSVQLSGPISEAGPILALGLGEAGGYDSSLACIAATGFGEAGDAIRPAIAPFEGILSDIPGEAGGFVTTGFVLLENSSSKDALAFTGAGQIVAVDLDEAGILGRSLMIRSVKTGSILALMDPGEAGTIPTQSGLRKLGA